MRRSPFSKPPHQPLPTSSFSLPDLLLQKILFFFWGFLHFSLFLRRRYIERAWLRESTDAFLPVCLLVLSQVTTAAIRKIYHLLAPIATPSFLSLETKRFSPIFPRTKRWDWF